MHHLVKSQKSFFNINLYKGEIHFGKRDGFGLQLFPNGCFYIGYWNDDKANGLGKLVLPDNTTYKGLFRKNIFVKGRIKYFNGTSFEGETDRSPQERFKKGTLIFSNGFKLTGEWKEGILAKGEMIDRNKRKVDLGNFDVVIKDPNGKVDDFGVIIKKGNRWFYEGVFRGNQCDGKGVIFNTFQQYKEAVFKEDKIHGIYRKVSLVNGEIVEGQCRMGEKIGYTRRMTNKGYYVYTQLGRKKVKISFPYLNNDYFEGEIDQTVHEKKPADVIFIKGTYNFKRTEGGFKKLSVKNVVDIFHIKEVKVKGVNFGFTFEKIFDEVKHSEEELKEYMNSLIDRKALKEEQLVYFLLRIVNPKHENLDHTIMGMDKSIYTTELKQITKSIMPVMDKSVYKRQKRKSKIFPYTDNKLKQSEITKKSFIKRKKTFNKKKNDNEFGRRRLTGSFITNSIVSDKSTNLKSPFIKKSHKKRKSDRFNIYILPATTKSTNKKSEQRTIKESNIYQPDKEENIKMEYLGVSKAGLQKNQTSQISDFDKQQSEPGREIQISQKVIKLISTVSSRNSKTNSNVYSKKSETEKNLEKKIDVSLSKLEWQESNKGLLSPNESTSDLPKQRINRKAYGTVFPRRIRHTNYELKSLFNERVNTETLSTLDIVKVRNFFDKTSQISSRFKSVPIGKRNNLFYLDEKTEEEKNILEEERDTIKSDIEMVGPGKKIKIVRKYDISRFEGKLFNGIMTGFCKILTKEGLIKEGNFINDKMNGPGFILYPHGVRLQGSFSHNSIKGNGVLIADNKLFAGFFEDKYFFHDFVDLKKNKTVFIGKEKKVRGKLNGLCTLVLKEGYKLEALLNNGRLVSGERCRLVRFSDKRYWIGKIRSHCGKKFFDSLNAPKIHFSIKETRDNFIFKEIKMPKSLH